MAGRNGGGGLKILLGPMRFPFLALTPACVLLGLAAAVRSAGHVEALHFVLALVGAVSAHASVNAFNEYFDFKSGLDFKTERTPFSGGSGTLPKRPEAAPRALAAAVLTLLATAAVGVYFFLRRGPGILPLGALGLLVIVLYTPTIVRRPFLCLIAPGLGFGPLMVMGTDFALTGGYSWTSFAASLVPFFLVSDLLLLNQFPDVEADASVGRRHLAILAGRRAGAYVYGLFLLCAYLSVVAAVCLEVLPVPCLLGLATCVLAGPAFLGALRYGNDTKKLVPYLGLNVIINILTPLLVAAGLFIG